MSDTESKPGKTDRQPTKLLSRAQALSYFRDLITSAFSERPPTAYEFRGRPLYTNTQLLKWASRLVARTQIAVEAARAEQK
jgi:hypothetical protein